MPGSSCSQGFCRVFPPWWLPGAAWGGNSPGHYRSLSVCQSVSVCGGGWVMLAGWLLGVVGACSKKDATQTTNRILFSVSSIQPLRQCECANPHAFLCMQQQNNICYIDAHPALCRVVDFHRQNTIWEKSLSSNKFLGRRNLYEIFGTTPS